MFIQDPQDSEACHPPVQEIIVPAAILLLRLLLWLIRNFWSLYRYMYNWCTNYESQRVDPSISILEADAGIEGYKWEVRQQRHYGGYHPNDLIEDQKETYSMVNQYLVTQQQQLTQQADVDNYLNINARYDQASLDVGIKIQPSAPDHSIEDSENERMEKFGGYNRWQEISQGGLNRYQTNTKQFTDFASSANAIQQYYQNEKEQDKEQKLLEKDNARTNSELQHIGG
ncbi:MAG: hypothetical protein EZS28_015396 [Streblomastix strix]|uniref:Uncharacterized protein n=1 Tax=Streblomastix strix TaxID=222440 RepID=A0A5J4W2N4_9EUKA|nr:MAG: hypothetical protein EZS28_015396 [Streblomastix strix]